MVIYCYHCSLCIQFKGIGTYILSGCVDHPCKFGKCFITSTSYRCQCQPGYGGTNCDEIVDSKCRHDIYQRYFYRYKKYFAPMYIARDM